MRAGTDMFGAALGGDTSGFGGLVRRAPLEASSPRPYGSWFDEAVDALAESFPGFGDAVTRIVVDRGELTLHVRPERVADVAEHLRDDADQRYEMLLEPVRRRLPGPGRALPRRLPPDVDDLPAAHPARDLRCRSSTRTSRA